MEFVRTVAAYILGPQQLALGGPMLLGVERDSEFLYLDIPLKPPREKLARVLLEDTYTLVAEFVLLLV